MLQKLAGTFAALLALALPCVASAALQSDFLKNDPDAAAVAAGSKTVTLPSGEGSTERGFSWKLLNAYRMLGYEPEGMPYGKMVDAAVLADIDAQLVQQEVVINAKAAKLPFYASSSLNTFKNNVSSNFGAHILASIYELLNAGSIKYQSFNDACTWASMFPQNRSNLVGSGTNGNPFANNVSDVKLPFVLQQTILYGFDTDRIYKNIPIPSEMAADTAVPSTLAYVGGFIHELVHDLDTVFAADPWVQGVYPRATSCTGAFMDFKEESLAPQQQNPHPFSWDNHGWDDCRMDESGLFITGEKCANYITVYAGSAPVEDAAESVEAFILAPDYFRSRARNSDLLARKYNYIKNNLFGGLEFVNPALSSTTLDFSSGHDLRNVLTAARVPLFRIENITTRVGLDIVGSTTTIQPQPRVALQTATTTYIAGQPIAVTWHTASSTTPRDWIGLVKYGGQWLDYTDVRSAMWFYTGGLKSGVKTIIAPNISGDYQPAYFLNDGYLELGRGPKIHIDAVPILQSDSSTYVPGQKITVTWNNPHKTSSTDWIGVVKADGNWLDYTGSRSAMWVGTNGTQTAKGVVTAPPISGQYQLAYFKNNGYTELERSDIFTVGQQRASSSVSLTAPFTVVSGTAFDVNWSISDPQYDDWIAIVPEDGHWMAGYPWFYTGGAKSGTKQLTGPLISGTYELVFYRNGKYDGNVFGDAALLQQSLVYRGNSIFVNGASSSAVVLVPARRSVGQNDAVSISWRVNAGDYGSADWIGVVPTGQQEWKNGDPWFYTDGVQQGMKFVAAPTQIGTYDIFYKRIKTNADGSITRTELQRVVGALEVRSSAYGSTQAYANVASVLFALEAILKDILSGLQK